MYNAPLEMMVKTTARRMILMKTPFLKAVAYLSLCVTTISCAAGQETKRIPQFSNDRVTAWETIIYPSIGQQLKMHRHDNDRILVAFDAGTLKVTDNKGDTHYLVLSKDKAYFLTKDAVGEQHTDQNISHHPIKVLVIQLKS